MINTHGVGYKVGVGERAAARYQTGDEVELYTHLVVRETSQELYGFVEFESLQMFEMLIEISGIGPKMAMGVLQTASPDEIKSAVASGNSELFRSVSGIGKKNTGRIILEMRSKLESLEDLDIIVGDGDDVVEALKNLGYSQSEISTVLKTIDREKSSEDQIREALKILGS